MKFRKYILWMFAIGIGIYFQTGCATVRPYQREYLASRIMDFDKEASEQALDRHWLETREGSSGGIGGSGGGCACN